jgi:cellulose synthase/poly-beta-1,6-N-acetylglucosamine synthase-like glycosyltransferase
MVVGLVLILLLFILGQLRVVVLLIYSSRLKKLGAPTVGTLPTVVEWPTVVVQLPVYREHRALRELLRAVLEMDYPSGRLGVQVLDDSEDEEAESTRAAVDACSGADVRIDYVHRNDREGYKSGALNRGTRKLDSELVAIFDADFKPDRDFLTRTVPLFVEPGVVAVHTRWRHTNDSATSLTQLQATVLDSLFCFESAVRQAVGQSSIYLGTSGVWRRRTIEELGGWREAPFTDDGIDLSFRAQLAGWSVVFLNEPLSVGTLPDTYLAYKNQQRRWARAAFRLAIDYWRTALRPPYEASARLLQVSSLNLVLSTPALLVAGILTSAHLALGLSRGLAWITVQLALTVAVVIFPPVQEGILSQKLLYVDWVRRSLRLLPALPLGIGVSVSIVAGFIDTLRPDEPEFVRTPKAGAEGVILRSRTQWLRSASRIAGVESALGFLFACAAVASVILFNPESWLLLLALAISFSVSGWKSWSEIRLTSRRLRPKPG